MDGEQYEEAIASFEKAIECDPNNHDLWYMKGNALFNLERYEGAFASYDRAANLQPDSFVAWESRGIALSPINGKIREGFLAQKQAIELAQELELNPDDPLYPIASQSIKFPSEYDASIEKMGRMEKLINFGRQGKFQLGIVFIVLLLSFFLSIALSPITLVVWLFHRLAKRT